MNHSPAEAFGIPESNGSPAGHLEGYTESRPNPQRPIPSLEAAYKLPLLTREEEVELAKRIEAGLFAEEKLTAGNELPASLQEEYGILVARGRAAKEHMIAANVRLVRSIAVRYEDRGELDDIMQVGYLALIRAVEKFDYKKGCKLSTYATWWIRAFITADLQQSSYIKVSKDIRKLAEAARRLDVRLPTSYDEGNLDTIAQTLGKPASAIWQAIVATDRLLSLDYHLPGSNNDYEEETWLIDPAEPAIDHITKYDRVLECADLLRKHLPVYYPRMKQPAVDKVVSVFKLRFCQESPYEPTEIVQQLGIPYARVRWYAKVIFDCLRQPSLREKVRQVLTSQDPA